MFKNLSLKTEIININEFSIKQLDSNTCQIKMYDNTFVIIFVIQMFATILMSFVIPEEALFTTIVLLFVYFFCFLIICYIVKFANTPITLTILLNKETGIVYQCLSLFNIKLIEEKFLYFQMQEYTIDKYINIIKYKISSNIFFTIRYRFFIREDAYQLADFIKNFFEGLE